MDLSNENIVHIKKNGLEFIQFRKLLEYRDIINHAYMLGKDVNFRTAKANKEKLPDDVFEKNCNDYKNACQAIGENWINVVKCDQNHTNNVKVVKEKINENKPDFNIKQYENTDGLVTNKSNMILTTTNADCIMLMFFDPVKKVIANVHSGWRGTLQRISVEAVKTMIDEFQCNPSDIICCICPSIRKCHFEVDQDVQEKFISEFSDLYDIMGERFYKDIIEYNEKTKKWNIDTVLINRKILEKIGLKNENIIDCGLCSVCNSDIMHSFRVEKENYGIEAGFIKIN